VFKNKTLQEGFWTRNEIMSHIQIRDRHCKLINTLLAQLWG